MNAPEDPPGTHKFCNSKRNPELEGTAREERERALRAEASSVSVTRREPGCY